MLVLRRKIQIFINEYSQDFPLNIWQKIHRYIQLQFLNKNSYCKANGLREAHILVVNTDLP